MVICIEMHSSWPPSWSAPLSTLQLPSEASIHLEGVCLWKIVNILSRSNLFLLKKGFHVWAQQMIMSYAHAVLYVPKDCKLPGNQFLFTTLSLSDSHLESAGWTVSAWRNSGGVFFHKKFLKKKAHMIQPYWDGTEVKSTGSFGGFWLLCITWGKIFPHKWELRGNWTMGIEQKRQWQKRMRSRTGINLISCPSQRTFGFSYTFTIAS